MVGATYALSATVNSGLTLSYSSSDTGVATVDASGNVTVVAAGTATLTVSQAGDSNYNAASNVTQTLTAVPPPIWTNPITGTTPNASNPYTTGDVKNANVTVSGIGRGSGITGGNATDRYNANGWNSTSLDANDYFYFTITPSSGYQVNFTSFVYTSQASTPAGMSFALRSSVDNYATDIGTATVTGTTIDLSGASFQNISSAITFRLYAWGAGSSANTFSVNSFSFNGSVDVVTYGVTYNANSATSGSVPTDATNYASGTSVTVAANSGALS